MRMLYRLRDKVLSKVPFIGVAMLFCVFIFSVRVEADPIKLCQESTSEDPFLNRLNIAGGTYFGYHAAIVARALHNLDISFTISRMPWRRCMAEAIKGSFDAVIGLGWSEERQKLFIFPLTDEAEVDESYRLYDESYPIYVISTSKLAWDGVQFSNIQFGIAAPKGFLVEKKLKELGALQEMDSGIDISLTLLEKSRVDGVVLSEEVGDRVIEEQLLDNIKKLQPVFFTQPLFLSFNKTQQKLTTKEIHGIWAEIRRIREKGQYKGKF